ncbi:MAG: hypothetical protein JXA38_05750 [Methanosarcinaceae archaeon]|nr:hypothetical protein [Methanosarcinaceae archaeon]
MRKVMVIALAMIILAMLVNPVSAEEAFSAITLDAKDVNCVDCHDTSIKGIHTLHEGTAATCVGCHGASLEIAIPDCAKCHSGPIHEVHIASVNTQECAYCHKGLEGVHNAALDMTVCVHCHTDLIADHGADASCVKCHENAPNIVKPYQTESMDIVCQACHMQSNVAAVHGNESYTEGCYKCHRPGQEAFGSQVPHNIHGMDVACVACHMDQDRIIIPECTMCHDVADLHPYATVGLKSTDDLQCSACHPDSYFTGEAPEETTEVPEETTEAPEETTEAAEEEAETGTPGFGAISAIGAIAALYFVSRRK